MKIRIASLCMYFLCIVFFAWAFPLFYQMIFIKSVDKTHMFYGPVDNNMIYTEQVLIDDMQAAAKSENHHADVVYKNEKGEYFTRNEFEAKVPFIYFRNMELRGKLPLQLHGKSFDRKSIEKERRVLEMPSRNLDNNNYKEAIYPLLDANPGQVALILPADRIRFAGDELQMIDSDKNAVDREQTIKYTAALKDKGFTFPALGVWGNFSTFKPYEAGVFIRDSAGKTFHLLRKNNVPEVTQVDWDADVVPQKIILAEAKDRKYLGLVLDTKQRMYILHQDKFALTQIPMEKYIPEIMDFKVIMDPLFITAVFSDDTHITAIAFNNADTLPSVLKPIHTYTHKMSQSQQTTLSKIADVLFPMSISFKQAHMGKGGIDLNISPLFVPFGIFFNLILAGLYYFIRKKQRQRGLFLQGASVVLFGLYVLIPLELMEQYKDRNVLL